jgi:O-antigen/teichoic acid export membrane protein
MTGSTIAHPPSSEDVSSESGAHERHLAAGSTAQQVTLVTGMFTGFVIVTTLARTLSLNEFGAYSLLISLPTYLFFAQGSVETVTVRAIAQARDQVDRDRAVTTAVCLYALFGTLAAMLIVFGGMALLQVLAIAPGLHHQAQLGLAALAVVNLIGWPVKATQDSLRGSGQFTLAAAAEALGYVTCGVLVIAALLLSAPLWILVCLGGAASLLIGLWATVVVIFVRLPIRVRTSTLSWPYLRSFLLMSLVLLISGISDLVIYSLDRTILSLYRPVRTVGLYEGPIRAHNLLRGLQAALSYTVIAAAAGYLAADDQPRLRELLLRGTRYVAIVMMPFTVVFMILSRPILDVWLGPRFASAAGAMTIFVSYWILLGGSSVGLSMMIAAGRLRTIVVYSMVVAALNLALSLALAPSLGLDGVVIGTSLPYALTLPIFAYLVCRVFGVTLREYAREGFTVAYTAGAILAGGELLGRVLLPLEQPILLVTVIVLGLAGYGVGVYRFGLLPRERLLIRTTLMGARRRLASLPAEISAAWLARSAG